MGGGTSCGGKDGAGVHGFVMTPPGHDGSGALPAILSIHGGPAAQFDFTFDIDHVVMAARGYAVIYNNPRGSTGRGEAYAAAIDAAWGSVDVEDVLASVAHAVAQGVADPERLVRGGWSYGGMLHNYHIARQGVV